MKRTIKLEIVIEKVEKFRTRNDVAIHSLEPSYNELLSLIDDALKDNFKRIVIYTKRNFWSRSNIHNGMSTWSRLNRDLGDGADVRAGMIQERFGQYKGDGFEIYFNAERLGA